jgi:hypothetical protein
MKHLVFLLTFFAMGCSSVGSVVDGTTGIVGGVIKDVSDTTVYILDTASDAVDKATPKQTD